VLFNQILEQNGSVGIEEELEAEGVMQVSAAVFERWLWSSRPAEEVVDELAALGIDPLEVVTRDEFAAQAELLSSRWVLDLVTALGGSAALLAGGVLLLFAVRRADRDRVAELMLARMGSTDGELRVTRAMELSFVALRARASSCWTNRRPTRTTSTSTRCSRPSWQCARVGRRCWWPATTSE
jgi:hypothetical protein